MREVSHGAAAPAGADGLATVLHGPDSTSGDELTHGVEIDRLAVEVHGDDTNGARGDLCGGVHDVQAVGVIHIDEDRRGSREDDGLDRRKRRVGGHEDFVTGLDAESTEDQPEGGRARAGEHHVADADRSRKRRLELPTLGAQNVVT